MTAYITLVANMSPRFIIYLLLISCLILFGIKKFSRLSREFKMLIFLVTYILFSEILSKILAFKFGNNMIVYHVLIPVQLVFYALFYIISIRKWKIEIIVVTFIAVCCCFLNSLFFQSIYNLPTNSLILQALIIVPLCLSHMKTLAFEENNSALNRNPLFWFNLGNLIFYTNTFFVFAYYNLIGNPPEWVFVFIWILNIILYGSYFLAFALNVNSNNLKA